MPRHMWTKFDRDWGWNLARLLAYSALQMLFAVVGLELIVLSLALRLVSPHGESQLAMKILDLLHDHVLHAAAASFETSLRSAPPWLLIVGLPISLWYGTRFFVVLESALCVIFRRRQRRYLQQNGYALVMLLLFAVLLSVILLGSVTLHFGPTHTTLSTTALLSVGDGPLDATIGIAASLAANFVLLLVAYTVITPGGVSPRACWAGALLGAALIQGYILLFPFYVRNVLHPDHFGTVAGFVLVILVFFFAYALFIVIGAELAAWHVGYRAATRDIPSILADAYANQTTKEVAGFKQERVMTDRSLRDAEPLRLPDTSTRPGTNGHNGHVAVGRTSGAVERPVHDAD
ncbi:MAG: YihY/virulence factor BrkB family protein [Ktedonobacterales bacterium]